MMNQANCYSSSFAQNVFSFS